MQKISLTEEHNAQKDGTLSGFFFSPSLHWDTNLLLREKTCYLWCLKNVAGQRCLSNQLHLSPHGRRGHLQLLRLPAAETLPDSQSELSRSQPWFLSANGEDPLCRWGRELGLPVLLDRNSKSLSGGAGRRDLQAQPAPTLIHRAGLRSAPDSLRHRLCCRSRFPLRQGPLHAQLFSHDSSIVLCHLSPPHAIGKVQILNGRINWIGEAVVAEWWKGQVKH